ncbi:MAG: flagellar biosynthesis protein FlgD [Pirellulaceae bacterium]|jgi:flagellar basal-body rod modification protein FlgD|nr:flagellar biosynthesis protein FlgD [Pirellulaceae bacterium]
MTSTSNINPVTTAGASPVSNRGLGSVNLDDFLSLMIAEMQNQDPLDPMKNTEMLQQLSQIRSIGATDKLTSTLDAVLLGQNLTTASSLIGRDIDALNDDGVNVQGRVDRVTVAPSADGHAATIRIHVGTDSIALNNIRQILPADEES